MMIYLHIILLLLIGTLTFGQQSITFSLVTEKNKIAIGDPINVSMRINYPAHIVPSSISFPELETNQKLNDTIDVLTAKAPTSISGQDTQGNPIMTWQQDFAIGQHTMFSVP
jgi:hypothetical protein